jgi:hypothetical protein
LLSDGRLLALADALEQCGQVIGGELPVERPGGAVIAVHEGQPRVADGEQAGEVAGGQDFLLDDGKDERWFAELTNRKLRRSAHRSVTELENDIRKWINEWNKNPRPFVWTKSADDILETVAENCQRITD